MERGNLEPSVLILRDRFKDLYSGKLKIIDFVVFCVLYEQASPMDGIAFVSYHGLGDLIGKGHTSVKNAMQRLETKNDIVVELPTQGQRAFKVGVVNYYCKGKNYTTALQFKTIFNRKEGSFCKVEEEIAKSESDGFAKSEAPESLIKSPRAHIAFAKSILDKSAKSLDIDKDLKEKINRDVDTKEDKDAVAKENQTDCKTPGEVLSSFFNQSSQSLGGRDVFGGAGSPYILNGFDLTKHTDWRSLVKRYSEADIINFIEQTSDSCRASTLGQAYGFVYKGLKKRAEEGWL